MFHPHLKIRLTVLVGALLFAWGAPQAVAGSYKARQVKGDVWYWEGVDVGWQPLTTGRIVFPDTLIQSMGACDLVFEPVGEKGSTIAYVSPSRALFRLSDDFLRRLRLGDSFAKNLPPLGWLEQEKVDELVNIADAWKTLNSPATNADRKIKPETKPKDEKEDEGKKADSQAGGPPTKIAITYPPKGGTFFVDGSSWRLPLAWSESADHKPPYDIFVKEPGATAFRPVGMTRLHRFDLQVTKSGPHAVRVQEKSGSVHSDEWLFNVISPDQ